MGLCLKTAAYAAKTFQRVARGANQTRVEALQIKPKQAISQILVIYLSMTTSTTNTLLSLPSQRQDHYSDRQESIRCESNEQVRPAPATKAFPTPLLMMGKRSRDASFSPTVEDSSSPGIVVTSPDADEGPPSKIVAENISSNPEAVMKCSLPPHRQPLDFDSLEAFEVHYTKEHTNRCSECGRNFPSSHFLSLHIEENHNPLREALQERGEKTYACFLPDCDRKCSTPQKRRLHLIDKHSFPRSYNFRVVDQGIDKSTSMLKEGHRRRISTLTDTTQSIGHRRRASSLAGAIQPSSKVSGVPTEVCQSHDMRDDTDVDDLEKSMSALRFIPASVTSKQGKRS